MRHRLTPAALVVLLCLGASPDATANSSGAARIEEIRALFKKLEAASSGPAPVDKLNKVESASWSRLQAWELKGGKSTRLRKLLVTRSDGSTTLERSFFFQGESLFFAFYVTTEQGSDTEPGKQEERLYFAKNGGLLRWQHNEERRPIDGHAIRWGAQARSDAKVAKALASGKGGTKGFEPVTCIVGHKRCQPMAGDCEMHFRVEYSLFPPPGLPVQEDLCSTSPWFAGYSQSCAFKQKGQALVVTRSGQEECGDSPGCDPHFREDKELALSPEMGRVEQCATLEEEEKKDEAP